MSNPLKWIVWGIACIVYALLWIKYIILAIVYWVFYYPERKPRFLAAAYYKAKGRVMYVYKTGLVDYLVYLDGRHIYIVHCKKEPSAYRIGDRIYATDKLILCDLVKV